MALATVVTTFDLADYFGTDVDSRRTKAWATNTAPDETIHDESTGETRVGSAYATIAADGTGSFSHWAPGADANPATWQTYYHFDVPDRATAKGRRTLTLGPFTVTGTSKTVTNKALTSNVATLTTSEAHGLIVGNEVTVAGVDATFNGTYTITAVPSTTTLSYAKTAADVPSAAATGALTSPTIMLTALVEEQIATPTASASDYADAASASATAADTSADAAAASATAAAASETAAETARDAAVDISNIATPDDLVEDLILNTGGAGPKTSAALSTSYVGTDEGEYPVGPPSGGDDTATINGIIADGIAAGHKKIVLDFESGTYLINGALVQTDNRNAQIPLPTVDRAAAKVTIVFRCLAGYDGAAKSTGFQTVVPTGGTILLSNLNVGAFSSTTGVASVIGGPAYGKAALLNTETTSVTNVKVVFDGVCVRQQSNPTAVSIDLSHAAQVSGAVVVDTNEPYATLAQCTHPQAAGVIMPQEYVANGWSDLDVWTCGYYAGWVPGECTSSSRIASFGSVIGQACQSNTHVAHIDYCLLTNNINHLAGWDPATGVTDIGAGHSDNPAHLVGGGKCFMSIGTLDLEHMAAPFATVSDIKDGANLLHLVARWAVFPQGPLVGRTGTANCALTSINADYKPSVDSHGLVFANGWADYGSGTKTAMYTKTSVDGMVVVEGVITGAAATSTTVATLPAGYRPGGHLVVFIPIYDTAGAVIAGGYLNILSDGTVKVFKLDGTRPTAQVYLQAVFRGF